MAVAVGACVVIIVMTLAVRDAVVVADADTSCGLEFGSPRKGLFLGWDIHNR
jgi:hypothetical protein